jgi:hypothetical protein
MRIESKARLGIVLICLCVLIVPVMAAGAYTTIPQGGTVFIGEQGLDLTQAMGGDTAIGWWASGAAIATSSPDAQMQVTPLSNFVISSVTFGQHTGNWYRLNSQGKPDGLVVAFVVADPSLEIHEVDTTINLDVTNKWVPRGDQVAFRIETNLNPIFSRLPGGSSSEGITIYVQPPVGGTYSALLDNSATPQLHSLENLVVSQADYTTPWSWDTGNSQYSTGTYTIWAECDVNDMYDNYGIPGKTISQQTTLLDQEQNPLISVNVPTTIATSQVSSAQTSPPPETQSTTAPVIIPTTTPGTPVPVVTTTLATVSPVATTSAPVATTTAISPGFDAIVTLVSIGALVLMVLKKQF